MPAEAQIEIGQARISGFDVGAFEETREEFLQRLADRETQLRAKPDQAGGNQNLESVRELRTGNGIVGKMFVHSRTVTEGTRANGLELERYRDEGVAVEALVHGAGVSIDLSAEYYDPVQIEELPALVAQLVPNPDNKLTGKAGFCLGSAYIRDPLTAEQGEQITMFGAIPRHPDVQFMLTLSAGLKPDAQGLLERSEESNSKLFFWQRMRISELRAAPREIAGLPGEELVESFTEHNGARVHSFWWEVNGTEDNVLIPHFMFRMDTGKSNNGPVPSSLSEHSALGLWDRILSSIRLQASAQPLRSIGARTPSTVK